MNHSGLSGSDDDPELYAEPERKNLTRDEPLRAISDLSSEKALVQRTDMRKR